MCSFYYPKLWTTLWFHHGATAWPGISRGRLIRVGRREMGWILWVSHAVRNDLAAEVFAGGGIDVWCPHIWKVIYRSAQKAWVLALPGRQDQLWEDLFILQMRLWKMWPGDRRLLLGNRQLHTLPSAQCIHYGIWLRWCRLRSESLFSLPPFMVITYLIACYPSFAAALVDRFPEYLDLRRRQSASPDSWWSYRGFCKWGQPFQKQVERNGKNNS